jgi:hypothetical protein
VTDQLPAATHGAESARFDDERSDESLTVRALIANGAWSTEGAHARRSIHRRQRWPGGSVTRSETRWAGRIWAERSDVLDRVSEGAGRLGQLSDWSDARLVVEVTRAKRKYGNSLGISFDLEEEMWAVSVDNGRGWIRRQLTPTIDELTSVARQLLHRKQAAESVDQPIPRTALRSPASLLLPSSFAGLLLHELIGHALEEGHLAGGDMVLPPDVGVVAQPPWSRMVDDGGRPAGTTVLIRDGSVVRRSSRSAAEAYLARDGHSWVGWHGTQPARRYPRLSVSMACPSRGQLPERYLRVLDVAGARYCAGHAVLSLAALELIDGDITVARYGGGHLVADLTILPQLKLLPVWEEPPIGACVKNGDVLASCCTAPTLVVPVSADTLVR